MSVSIFSLINHNPISKIINSNKGNKVFNNLVRVLCCKLLEEDQKVEKLKCDLNEDIIKSHIEKLGIEIDDKNLLERMINIFLCGKMEYVEDTKELQLYYRFDTITLKSPLPLTPINEDESLILLFNVSDLYINKISEVEIDKTFHPVIRESSTYQSLNSQFYSQDISIGEDINSNKIETTKRDLINPTRKKRKCGGLKLK